MDELAFVVVAILSETQIEVRFRYLGVPEFWFNLASFLTVKFPTNRTKTKLKYSILLVTANQIKKS